MKTFLRLFCVISMAGILMSCGKSGGASSGQAPDPATQPEAQAAVFQRTCDRIKGLIEAKDYKQAQLTIDSLKSYKLTPEQQKIADGLQAQIPK